MEQTKPCKVMVPVCAEFDTEGKITPIFFVWEDGMQYNIDRIVDIRRAASLKAGGIGMRYTCIVHGRQTYLFLDEDRWFMERRG